MKEIEIDREIRRNPTLHAAVDRATRMLEEELGKSAGLVSAEWVYSEADKNPLILKISDWTGSAATRISDAALEPAFESRLRIVLGRLWGDLLQIRSHKQMEVLNKLVKSLEDGGA